MKIKLIRNHNLNKSRGHLVKVAKQIQGKTGAYQSHRWINPNKALEVLKQDIGGVKATDELTFTDKQSGREISEKELLKEYQKKGKGQTIQQYVKGNYSIKQDEQLKIGNYYNETIEETEINKDVLPVLDTKYPEIDLTKIKKIEIEVDEEEDNYIKGSTFQNLKLPKLEGSRIDVEKAEKIRQQALDLADEYIEYLGNQTRYGGYSEYDRLDAQKFYTTLKKETDAQVYINFGQYHIRGLGLPRDIALYYDESIPIDKSINFHHEQMRKYRIGRKKKMVDKLNENIAENKKVLKGGLRPETLNNAPRHKPMTFEQADLGSINPKFNNPNGRKEGYHTNCQSAIVVFEARLRGYDLETLPNTTGSGCEKLSSRSAEAWIDPTDGASMTNEKATIILGTSNKLYKHLNETIKVGERYSFAFSWAGRRRAGHVVAMYKNEKDELVIYDPQVSEFTQGEKEIRQYLSQLKYKQTINRKKYDVGQRLIRIDNKVIDTKWLDRISKPSDDKTKGLTPDTGKNTNLDNIYKQLETLITDDEIKKIDTILEPLYNKENNQNARGKSNKQEAKQALSVANDKINIHLNNKSESQEKAELQNDMKNLYEQISAGTISISQAINDPRFKNCAYLLIMAMLEEDMEEEISNFIDALI